jgi:arylsulfatase A-like enzyme
MSATPLPDHMSRSPAGGRDRPVPNQIRAIDLLLLSAWCGLPAGLLEVAARVLCRFIDPANRLYLVSRHFLWLGPLSNLFFFAVIGAICAITVKLLPRAAVWFSLRLICALAALPMLMAAGPQIYPEAWFLVAFGIAVQIVPLVKLHSRAQCQRLAWSFVLMSGIVLLLAGYVLVGDWLKQHWEAGRPLRPANTPNVLLIVLDTVRADHLSPYGYERPTTPNLQRIANRGIRFDNARATAPWTLPSHASMFTGRWPHELVTKWMTPLRGSFPFLAEYLGRHGYATAGFVGNVVYCSYETGLDRGFTHYEDYDSRRLAPLRTARLVDYATTTFSELIRIFDISPLRDFGLLISHYFDIGGRKDAASINSSFLDWLSDRPDSGRPFFIFLNYIDAHASYILPQGGKHRFGSSPQTQDELGVVYQKWVSLDKTRLPQRYIALARDCYDDCLGYIDDQLGVLFDELERRGDLDQTLIVVTADHGEGLGDHNLFDHGESLYRAEVRVPLVIMPPHGVERPIVLKNTVSLRSLSATIVDLLGLNAGSPFPGQSLARFWRARSFGDAGEQPAEDPIFSELTAPNPMKPNQGRSPGSRGPLISLADDNFVYIRNERDGSEQLFDERNDPQEFTDKAAVDSMQPVLNGFRHRLNRFRGNSSQSAR